MKIQHLISIYIEGQSLSFTNKANLRDLKAATGL